MADATIKAECQCINQSASAAAKTTVKCTYPALYPSPPGIPMFCGMHMNCKQLAASVKERQESFTLLPPELWLQIMSDVDLDEWVKYTALSSGVRSLANSASVLKSVKLITVHDRLSMSNSGLSGLSEFSGFSFLPVLMKLGLAGNLGARVRLLNMYAVGGAVTDGILQQYPDFPLAEWLTDTKIVPYLMWQLSTPYAHSPTLVYMHSLLPVQSREIYDRVVPLPRTRKFKPIKLPTGMHPSVLDWMCEVCVKLGIMQVFTLARHIYLWYNSIRKLDDEELQLCAVVAIRLAGRTLDEPTNTPVGTTINLKDLVRRTAGSYIVNQAVHYSLVMAGLLPPIDVNIPSLIFDTDVRPKMYLYPLFSPDIWDEALIGALYDRYITAKDLIRLHAEGTVDIQSVIDKYRAHDRYVKQHLLERVYRGTPFLDSIKEEETNLLSHVARIIATY